MSAPFFLTPLGGVRGMNDPSLARSLEFLPAIVDLLSGHVTLGSSDLSALSQRALMRYICFGEGLDNREAFCDVFGPMGAFSIQNLIVQYTGGRFAHSEMTSYLYLLLHRGVQLRSFHLCFANPTNTNLEPTLVSDLVLCLRSLFEKQMILIDIQMVHLYLNCEDGIHVLEGLISTVPCTGIEYLNLINFIRTDDMSALNREWMMRFTSLLGTFDQLHLLTLNYNIVTEDLINGLADYMSYTFFGLQVMCGLDIKYDQRNQISSNAWSRFQMRAPLVLLTYFLWNVTTLRDLQFYVPENTPISAITIAIPKNNCPDLGSMLQYVTEKFQDRLTEITLEMRHNVNGFPEMIAEIVRRCRYLEHFFIVTGLRPWQVFRLRLLLWTQRPPSLRNFRIVVLYTEMTDVPFAALEQEVDTTGTLLKTLFQTRGIAFQMGLMISIPN